MMHPYQIEAIEAMRQRGEEAIARMDKAIAVRRQILEEHIHANAQNAAHLASRTFNRDGQEVIEE